MDLIKHGVYKYVLKATNEIIYVGKADNGVTARIKKHEKGKDLDEKFVPYKGHYKIFVASLPNSTETDIFEKALINKYKPILNDISKRDGISGLINVDEPEWIDYDNYCAVLKTINDSDEENLSADDILLGESNDGIKYFVSNPRRDTSRYFLLKDDCKKNLGRLVKYCHDYGVKGDGWYGFRKEEAKAFLTDEGFLDAIRDLKITETQNENALCHSIVVSARIKNNEYESIMINSYVIERLAEFLKD